MPLWLLASSVARFTVAGSTPHSIAGSKVGLLPKTWDLRAIGARDKLAVSPRRRRWANPPAPEAKFDTTSTTFCLILYQLLKTVISEIIALAGDRSL